MVTKREAACKRYQQALVEVEIAALAVVQMPREEWNQEVTEKESNNGKR